MDYMRKEWRDNRPVPMDEAKLTALIKAQAEEARAIYDKK